MPGKVGDIGLSTIGTVVWLTIGGETFETGGIDTNKVRNADLEELSFVGRESSKDLVDTTLESGSVSIFVFLLASNSTLQPQQKVRKRMWTKQRQLLLIAFE